MVGFALCQGAMRPRRHMEAWLRKRFQDGRVRCSGCKGEFAPASYDEHATSCLGKRLQDGRVRCSGCKGEFTAPEYAEHATSCSSERTQTSDTDRFVCGCAECAGPATHCVPAEVCPLCGQRTCTTCPCLRRLVREGRGCDSSVPASGFVSLSCLSQQMPDGLADVGGMDRGAFEKLDKRQEGTVWRQEGMQFQRLTGIWFDAFVVLCQAVDIPLDRATAWSLWKRFLSRKVQPVIEQNPPGLISPRNLRNAVLQLVEQWPFFSEATFRAFTEHAKLGIPRNRVGRFYESVCENTQDAFGARNLVFLSDFHALFRSFSSSCQPYIKARSGKMVKIGGLWLEPLYQTVVSAIPEVPEREQVQEHFNKFVPAGAVLLPVDKTFDVIALIGRPGVKYDQFRAFVQSLGMRFEEAQLREAFDIVDTDQSKMLGREELEAGMRYVMLVVVPRTMLGEMGLSVRQLIRNLVATGVLLAVVFLFLVLSFKELAGGGATSVGSAVQSVMALGASATVKFEKSSGLDTGRLKQAITRRLERITGTRGVRKKQKQE